MNPSYDKYYQTKQLFGDPHPILIQFFTSIDRRGTVLDLGCGQGRNAIPLARLGFTVMGIDSSKVGIAQMIKSVEKEHLPLTGLVEDLYTFDSFEHYDVILLDSMFHFTKKDRQNEVGLIKMILSKIQKGSLLVICNQDSGSKLKILNHAIKSVGQFDRLLDQGFKYLFHDKESGHHSESNYRMIVVEK